MVCSKANVIFGIIAIALIAVACGNREKTRESGGGIITEAACLSIEPAEDYTVVRVANPWKEGATLQTYVLIPRDSQMPENLPAGTVVRTPVERAVVYSSVHGSLIDELGAIGVVAGVADAQYFNMPQIQGFIAAGEVVDVGNSMSPLVERIVAIQPDAIILSPFQNAGYGAIESLGVPIIECADYMEATPLGRAEWVKFFGLLLGCEQMADSIFSASAAAYNELKLLVAEVAVRPMVLTEMLFSGVWYVPAGSSYMATMLTDAGARYPWSDTTGSGSLSLDAAQVLDRAGEADIWLIKPMAELTYGSLGGENELYTHFKAYREQQVYQCVTTGSTYFQDFPFHPEALLREYVALFHPECLEGYTLRYYTPLLNE